MHPVVGGEMFDGISRLQKLLDFAREHCMPTLFTLYDGGPDLLPRLATYAPNHKVFGKFETDAFSNAAFGAFLTGRGITHVAVGGFDISYSVEATVSSACARGFNVLTAPELLFGEPLDHIDYTSSWQRSLIRFAEIGVLKSDFTNLLSDLRSLRN